MTEEEWLTSEDATAMLVYTERVGSYRKRRLFMLDCAQRVCHLLGKGTGRHPTRELLAEAYEVLDDGAALIQMMGVQTRGQELAAGDAARLFRAVEETRSNSRQPVRHASIRAVASNLIHVALNGERWWHPVVRARRGFEKRRYEALEGHREQVCRENLHALRCIVGNPFRPVAFEPTWRTEAAVGLALRMYDDRNFDAMPILADALEEAGCGVPAVLDHCREPGPHARGCWVVDGVLGKR